MTVLYNAQIPLAVVARAAAGGVGTELLGNAAATTVAGTIRIPFKCEVRQLQVTIRGTSTHATVMVVNFRNRPTAGTATGDSSIGTITKLASNQQGKTLYKNPTTKVTMSPGSEIALVVDTANGDAVDYSAGVLVEQIPEDPANITAMVASA